MEKLTEHSAVNLCESLDFVFFDIDGTFIYVYNGKRPENKNYNISSASLHSTIRGFVGRLKRFLMYVC